MPTPLLVTSPPMPINPNVASTTTNARRRSQGLSVSGVKVGSSPEKKFAAAQGPRRTGKTITELLQFNHEVCLGAAGVNADILGQAAAALEVRLAMHSFDGVLAGRHALDRVVEAVHRKTHLRSEENT